MGTQLPPQRGTAPFSEFSAHLCCNQMARWIKMPLGMEVGLSTGDIVLHGNPAPSPKGGGAPNFPASSFVAQMHGCTDQDTTWYGSRPRPRRHCVRRGPAPPPEKRGRAPIPNFRPMSICGHGFPSQLLLSSCFITCSMLLIQ